MKHVVIVLGIILFVSLSFLDPFIESAIDMSFNDYAYLQKIRRTHSDVNTDDKSKGWQENGTFNSWYQKGNGSEDDKALNNIKSTTPSSVPVPSNTIPSNTIPSNTVPSTSVVPTKTNTPAKSSSDETTKETESGLNIIPYLLLILLIMIVILVVYIKYKYV